MVNDGIVNLDWQIKNDNSSLCCSVCHLSSWYSRFQFTSGRWYTNSSMKQRHQTPTRAIYFSISLPKDSILQTVVWIFTYIVWQVLNSEKISNQFFARNVMIKTIMKYELLLPANWKSLQWRHNGCDRVSNHQPHDCLLTRLFRRRSKKTSRLRVTGLCAGNSPVTGEFPAQMTSDAENVSIWWRHHVNRPLELTLKPAGSI